MQKKSTFIQLTFLHVGVPTFWEWRSLVGSPLLSGESQEGICALLPWLVSFISRVWLIVQLIRLWRLSRGLHTPSGYLFLLHARWQGVLRLAAWGCGWLITGSWASVLISGKQKLRPSLPACLWLTQFCFLMEFRTTSPGMSSPTISWVLFYQSPIKNMT